MLWGRLLIFQEFIQFPFERDDGWTHFNLQLGFVLSLPTTIEKIPF